MDEQDFWSRLEQRISAEFQGFADARLRWYWCDGLIAEQYHLAGPQPSISGQAWCGPSGQERWRFTLVLPPGAAVREQIDWQVLLPGDQATGWLTPDPAAKHITIDPMTAVRD